MATRIRAVVIQGKKGNATPPDPQGVPSRKDRRDHRPEYRGCDPCVPAICWCDTGWLSQPNIADVAEAALSGRLSETRMPPHCDDPMPGLDDTHFNRSGGDERERDLVEPRGIEPLTSCMPCKRSPS